MGDSEGDVYYGRAPGGYWQPSGIDQWYIYHDGKWYYMNSDGTPSTPAVGQPADTQTGDTPSGQPQEPKSPDPVVSGRGGDYAGFAKPVRGRVDVHTNLGVGKTMRSYGLAQSLNDMRSTIQQAADKARRRRPRHNTRSWQHTAQDLKRKFDEIANEFAHDFQRARIAAGRAGHHIRFVEDLAHGGHGHLVHMEL